MNIEDTLQERGNIYGDYTAGVLVRSAIMEALKAEYMNTHGSEMPLVSQGYLWDIVNKLCRLAVSPDHLDSWHDIQGYAKLTEESLCEPTKS